MKKYLLHILIISFVFLLAPSGCNISKFNLKIDKLQSEVRKNPDYADAHYNLGIAYHELGKYKEAIESYKHAVRINPDFALTHYNLGYAYIILRDKSSALKQHKILKKLDTKRAKKLLGMIYTELD